MNQESDLDLTREILKVSTDPSERARHEARTSLLDRINAEDHVVTAPRLRRRVWAAGNRRVGVLAAALVIGASSAAAATVAAIDGFGHDSPTRLFQDNPVRFFSPWVTQALVPGTVRLVTTLSVPTVGRAEYWTAESTHHGVCVGLRLPGGAWAGSPNRFEVGGPVPGCVYRFSPTPRTGWSPKRGFFWDEDQVGGRWQGRIVYGTVPNVGRPVMVRDALSGTSTHVIDGRYFAILIPPSHGQYGSWQQGHARVERLRYRLETLDALGRVLATAPDTIEP